MSVALDVMVVHEVRAEHVGALECLADHASEPNPFYEPWMLVPALKTQPRGRLHMVMIWGPDPLLKNAPQVLYGFLPLEEKRNLYNLPVRYYTTWKHNYCFLCTPLVRKGFERETLAGLFEWLETHKNRPAVLQFKYITAEGPVYQALVDVLRERKRAFCVWEVFNRALFKPRESAEHYQAAAFSGIHRKEFRRKQRALGEVSFRVASNVEELERAQREFLEIEARGWKGREGTALSSAPEDREFFIEMTREGFARKRVMLLSLYAEDRPIAVKCNLLSGAGSFAFKIGFDEEFEKLSPGALLELENIRVLHEHPEIEWMDSCASPVHFMINRMWLDRRTIQSIIVSTGKISGDLLIPTLPWLKFMKERFT